MGTVLGNALVYALTVVGIAGLVLMLAGFGRLLAQAWRMPDRGRAVRRALCVRPRRSPGWPDSSAGAELVAKGAMCGVVLFVGLLALAAFGPKSDDCRSAPCTTRAGSPD